jgi:spore coat polysaccharide biosynthesis protein SpsF
MKVVATLACRVQSKRLYAKPLQLIDMDNDITILEYLANFLKSCQAIDEIVLAISEGGENKPFEALAHKMNLPYVIGPEFDVQQRLILASEKAGGDIVYRVTTECPFIYMDEFEKSLNLHIQNKAALTVIENLPEGTYYEIINKTDLKAAHDQGEERHRSELCTLYMFEHPEKFYLQRLRPDSPKVQRPDIRLTVDYPEDLIVVREVYRALKKEGRFIKIEEIIEYLDAHPQLKAINGWIDAGIGRIWS